jgi:hypothetical protein
MVGSSNNHANALQGEEEQKTSLVKNTNDQEDPRTDDAIKTYRTSKFIFF